MNENQNTTAQGFRLKNFLLGAIKPGESRVLAAFKEKVVLLLALAVIIVIFSLLSPYFFQGRNFVVVLRQNSIRFLLAIAMTLVVVSGGIDLSVGSNMAFSSIIAALCMKQFGVPGIYLGIAAGLAGGLAVGLLNGYIIGRLKINSWLVTLAMLTLVRGLAYVISRGRLVGNIPREFSKFMTGTVGAIPVIVLIAVLLGLIFHFLLSSTYFGSSLKGLGANITAASYCGLPVADYQLVVYGISGLLAAVAGIIIIGNVASTAPYIAIGIELDAIAGTVVGGASFGGGVGSIAGTALGILRIGIIQNGLTVLGLSTPYLKLARGLILVIVVAADTIRESRFTR